MNQERLNTWIQLAVGVCVVVGLGLVIWELRENTLAVKANTSQAIFDSSREFVLEVALSEDLSRIRRIGRQDTESLDEDELARFRAIVLGNWIYFQNVWIQWDLGVIDDRVWDTYVRIFCGSLRMPGTFDVWSRQKHLYDPKFVQIIISTCEIETKR